MTIEEINKTIERYEKHFGLPFPKRTFLFKVGNPDNLQRIDEIFARDKEKVEEAIKRNTPLDEIEQSIWDGIYF